MKAEIQKYIQELKALNEDKLELISDLITEETGFCHLGFQTIPPIK